MSETFQCLHLQHKIASMFTFYLICSFSWSTHNHIFLAPRYPSWNTFTRVILLDYCFSERTFFQSTHMLSDMSAFITRIPSRPNEGQCYSSLLLYTFYFTIFANTTWFNYFLYNSILQPIAYTKRYILYLFTTLENTSSLIYLNGWLVYAPKVFI